MLALHDFVFCGMVVLGKCRVLEGAAITRPGIEGTVVVKTRTPSARSMTSNPSLSQR